MNNHRSFSFKYDPMNIKDKDDIRINSNYDELEYHFQERYSILKESYEIRLKQLSESILEVCNTITNDETISELKKDKISSYFLPNHISEILSSHLHTKRELQLQQTILKLKEMEVTCNRYELLAMNQQEQIDELTNSIIENTNMIAVEANDQTHSIISTIDLTPIQQKLGDIEQQYYSFTSEAIAHEEEILLKLKTLEEKEEDYQQKISDLSHQLDLRNQDNQHLNELNTSLHIDKKHIHDLELQIEELNITNTNYKKRMNSLESQILLYEGEVQSQVNKENHLQLQLLNDSKESNSNYHVINDKLKTCKSQLTRELRLNKELNEELLHLRILRENQNNGTLLSYFSIIYSEL